MTSNRKSLEALFKNNKIRLRRGSLFDTPPEPMPEGFEFDRVKGMMLGLAIGDSLGKPTVKEACDQWYSGAYLLETVPCVIFILMKHGDNLEEAIVRAVNDTRDNDTIAAIVGAAVGALHGKQKIPAR